MRPRPLNPFDRERQLVWRNRIAEWRAHPDESGFHGVALILAAALGVYLLLQALPSITMLLRHAIAQWPVPLLMGALVMVHLQHVEALRACDLRLQSHWLAAQPVAAVIARRLRRRAQLFALLGYALGGCALLLVLEQPRLNLGIWLAGSTLAILAAPLYRSNRRRALASTQRRLPFAITASGSFWRWQWIEAWAVMAPRRLAAALWLLLLAPAGHWSAMVIALVLVVLYLLITAWHSSLSVLPAAERWLTTQPLQAGRWLRDCLPVPLLILTAGNVLLTAVLAATASLRHAPILLTAISAVALLHLACAAAERRRRQRAEMVFALHLLVLIALLQSLPILLLPAWIAQMSWLIRRSLRS